MADGRGRVAIAVALLSAAAAVPGCKAAAGKDQMREPVSTIDEAELALADNERRLSELGIVPPSKAGDADGLGIVGEAEGEEAGESEAVDSPEPMSEPPRSVGVSAGSDRAETPKCTRICDIAESTCALAQQVCDPRIAAPRRGALPKGVHPRRRPMRRGLRGVRILRVRARAAILGARTHRGLLRGP